MSIKISTAARNAACDAIVDRVDLGASAGTLELRSGSPPATPASPDSGTLLVTFTLSDPAFGAASNGTAMGGAITPGTAVANGDAGHFRVKDSDGNVIFQGTAGEGVDAPDFELDEKTIVVGATIDITSAAFIMPAGE